MTQESYAQRKRGFSALRKRASVPSLAQRRAAFAAQMRAMALSELQGVSDRLKGLHAELEHREGRKWTQQDLADKMDIPYRTFQSWEGGEVENRDGKGYDRIARFYSRRLGRKITRQWILFGDAEPTSPLSSLDEATSESALAEVVNELQSEVAELRGELSEVHSELQRALSRSPRDEHDREGSDN